MLTPTPETDLQPLSRFGSPETLRARQVHDCRRAVESRHATWVPDLWPVRLPPLSLPVSSTPPVLRRRGSLCRTIWSSIAADCSNRPFSSAFCRRPHSSGSIRESIAFLKSSFVSACSTRTISDSSSLAETVGVEGDLDWTTIVASELA